MPHLLAVVDRLHRVQAELRNESGAAITARFLPCSIRRDLLGGWLAPRVGAYPVLLGHVHTRCAVSHA